MFVFEFLTVFVGFVFAFVTVFVFCGVHCGERRGSVYFCLYLISNHILSCVFLFRFQIVFCGVYYVESVYYFCI